MSGSELMSASSAAQAHDRVSVLCGRIWRDIRIFEEERDPQIIDNLCLQMDLLLQHLHGLRAPEETLEVCAHALALLSQLGDERELQCRTVHVEYVNCPRAWKTPV